MNPNPPSNPEHFGAPPPPPAAPAAKKPAGMAWTAFILSFFGCLCLPSIVSFILGLVVLIKDKGGKGLAIAALVISGLGVPVTGILAAIAIPSGIKYQARAKQSECKGNLTALYMAEKAYFQENDRYSEDMQEIGFTPDHPRRYTYFVSESEEPIAADENPLDSADELPDLDELEIGVMGECPACEFTAVCVGNIDADPALDVWAISTIDQTENSQAAPAGQPYQLADDVTD